MKLGWISLGVGVLFGMGLTLSGMTQPAKVIGFLDIFGSWDPTLAFVMIGAISVHAVAYRLKQRRTSPFLSDRFYLPEAKGLDRKLVAGAVLFGAGWGLAGYCPGPGIVSLVSLQAEPFVFVGAMTVGMFVQDVVMVRRG